MHGKRAFVLLGFLGLGCGSGQIDGSQAPAPPAVPGVPDKATPPASSPKPADSDGAVAQPKPGTPTGFVNQASRCADAKTTLPAALRLHTAAELKTTFAALAAPATVAFDVAPEFARVEGLPNDQTQLTVTPAYLSTVGDNGKALASALAARAPFASPACTADVPPACRDDVLRPLGRLIWRRPLDADEITWLTRRLAALPASLSSRARVEAAVRMLALSPQAIFRFESPPSSQPAPMNAWQSADVIAYALTGGPADADLARAADTGELADPNALRAQVRRVMALPAAQARLTQLLSDSFDIQDPELVRKDAKAFPEFTPALTKSMKASFATFASGVFLGEGSTFQSLFTASSFAETSGTRAGIFTHPAFLSAQADETATRPIHRARAVLERALCVHLPDPPASAAMAKPVADPALSPRQRFEKLTSTDECTGCHSLLNPIGFSLDGYDAIGRPRTTFENFPIDVSGKVALDGTTVSYDTPSSLMKAVSASTAAHECFVTRVHRHVVGRKDTSDDVCLKVAAVAALKTTDNVRDALVETISSATLIPRRTP